MLYSRHNIISPLLGIVLIKRLYCITTTMILHDYFQDSTRTYYRQITYITHVTALKLSLFLHLLLHYSSLHTSTFSYTMINIYIPEGSEAVSQNKYLQYCVYFCCDSIKSYNIEVPKSWFYPCWYIKLLFQYPILH